MNLRTMTCFAFLLCLGASAMAGTTGKIAGVVKDAQSGEPLVGASVQLLGTTQGAATNIDGYFAILNIQPGKYTVVASAVGYTKRTVTNVSVSIDLTSTVDFTLSSSAVEVEEVVTTAKRPMVQKDETAKTAVVNGEQIAALPVTEVGQVLNLQAGYVKGSLRGGRSGEVAYWIDGVPVTDGYDGSEVVEVNKNLVQELQLVSGAFNAEYGQAMSGIVNIATKEGSDTFTGGIGTYLGGYLTNATGIFPGNDNFRPTSIRNYEANLSGPILGKDLTFFVNGRYYHTDGWLYGFNRFNPSNVSYTDSKSVFHLYRDESGRGDSSRVSMNGADRYYAQGKLTYHLSPTIKLSANYIFDWSKSRPTSADYRSYYYNPNGFGYDHNKSNTIILQWSQTLNDRTFYTVGASYFDKDYKYYVYEDIHDSRYVHPDLLDVVDSYSFYTGGTDMRHTYRSTKTALIKADISSQITDAHLVKIGAEFRRHAVSYEYILLQPIDSQSSFTASSSDPYIQTQVMDLSSYYHDKYLHHPTEAAAYVQDKMEFKDLIVNVGLRFDYFQPDANVLNDAHSDPSDPLYYQYTVDDPDIYNPQKAENQAKTLEERMTYWYKKATAKWQFSPRIGFSFPITANGIVHFSYGHFFQIPRFEKLYLNPQFKIGNSTIDQVGNADLKPEETINGELGVQQQLTEDVALDVTAYLRDIRNLTGTRNSVITVYGGSLEYAQFTNSDFGFVKGIVLTLNKRFAGGLTATLDYTYQVARGTASDPEAAKNAVLAGEEPEMQMTALDWDQRHTLNGTLAYHGNSWGGSLIMQYGSGAPYTPTSTTDISTILTNSQLKPAWFNLDVQAYYEIPLDKLRLVAFVRVFNLLDARNAQDVFAKTGDPGYTTDYAVAAATNPNQYVNTLTQWFTYPTHYSEPRRVEFGMNLEF